MAADLQQTLDRPVADVSPRAGGDY